MNQGDYLLLIKQALQEDLGELGDVTTEPIVRDKTCQAILKSKDSGVLAGSMLFRDVFLELNGDISLKFYYQDGDELHFGDTVAEVEGDAAAVLKGERVALNFLSFLSGIATQTRRLQACLSAHSKCVLLDTRKTLPGYRIISKYAVRIGGGQNHRLGLYDQVLIKDNHVDVAGSVSQAVSAVRAQWGNRFLIEVECRNLLEVGEALENRVDIIMLDNFPYHLARQAVKLIDKRAKIEISGNIDAARIKKYSRLAVDYISAGQLTHSVRAFDFSLVMEYK